MSPLDIIASMISGIFGIPGALAKQFVGLVLAGIDISKDPFKGQIIILGLCRMLKDAADPVKQVEQYIKEKANEIEIPDISASYPAS